MSGKDTRPKTITAPAGIVTTTPAGTRATDMTAPAAPLATAEAATPTKKPKTLRNWIIGSVGAAIVGLAVTAVWNYSGIALRATIKRPQISAMIYHGISLPDDSLDEIILIIENSGATEINELEATIKADGLIDGKRPYIVRDTLGEPIDNTFNNERRMLYIKKRMVSRKQKIMTVLYVRRGSVIPRESITIRTKETGLYPRNKIQAIQLN